MPTFTRPQRQILATVVVAVLMIIPTAWVALMAWRVNRAGHIREVEEQLRRQLGARVALEGVRYPRPGEVVYRGVVVRTEEPGRKGAKPTEVARAEVLRVRREGGELIVEADGLRLSGESPKQALAQVAAWLDRAGGSGEARASFTARSCRVELGDGQGGAIRFELCDVAATYRAEGERGVPVVSASYYLAGPGPATRCELALSRGREAATLRTALVFKTMDGPPPVAGARLRARGTVAS
ncbi:MAG: hypothetical protein IRY99_19090, partial [Isosphaeraceae bacterium]|nr:hypothetical protein [Isosphaeraceae bacterium]